MLAMASGGLALHRVAERSTSFPPRTWPPANSGTRSATSSSTSPGSAAAVWDLIQPSFMFMVGVAMAYSCASRQAHGQSYAHMLRARRACGRSCWCCWAFFCASDGRLADKFHVRRRADADRPGLRVFVPAVGSAGLACSSGAAVGILVGYWCLFYFYPLPGPDFDYALGGRAARLAAPGRHCRPLGQEHQRRGLLRPVVLEPVSAQAAVRLQRWRLPDAELHPLAGHDDLRPAVRRAVAQLAHDANRNSGSWLAAGLVGLASGELFGETGICPIVKRIWTPSWALFSTGWTCLILAAFYGVVDMLKFRWWTFPLVVVGMNSITMYCMEELSHGWFVRAIKTHTRISLTISIAAWVARSRHLPNAVLSLPTSPTSRSFGACGCSWRCGSFATGSTGKRSSFASRPTAAGASHDADDQPRLRRVESFPISQPDGQVVFALRDPEGFSGSIVLPYHAAIVLASLMDGTRTLAEVQVDVRSSRRANRWRWPTSSTWSRELDDRHFLDDERFRARWKSEIEQYLESARCARRRTPAEPMPPSPTRCERNWRHCSPHEKGPGPAGHRRRRPHGAGGCAAC